MGKRVTIIKIASFILILIVLGIGSSLLDTQTLLDRDALRNIIAKNFWYGALLFIFITTLLKMLFVPLAPVSIAAGYLFGTVFGMIIAIISAVLSSIIPFFLARALGSDFVREIIENRFKFLKQYENTIKNHGFSTVFFFRIVPVLPHMVVNLGFGLTQVRIRDFVLASFAGVLPGTILLVYIGNELINYSDPKIYVFVGLYIALVAFTLLIARRERKIRKITNTSL